jgi:hypothetical protein
MGTTRAVQFSFWPFSRSHRWSEGSAHVTEPRPGADVAAASLVPVQMWQRRARSSTVETTGSGQQPSPARAHLCIFFLESIQLAPFLIIIIIIKGDFVDVDLKSIFGRSFWTNAQAGTLQPLPPA